MLGLDIGGTSSRGRLSQDGRTVAEAEGEGANPTTVDPMLIDARLTKLIADVGPPEPSACCAGVAGSEFPEGRRLITNLLARLLPRTEIVVVHDARLILAAAGIDSGIALIAGTGSVAYGRDAAGNEARAGGWGWMLGDEGGGAWITREGVRELLRRRDTGEPAGALGEALFAATRTHDALELAGKLQGDHLAGHWAASAGSVLDSGDPAADDIVARAADALAALVGQVRTRLSIDGPVVMAGGMLLYFPVLVTALRGRIGEATLLQEEPVAGAVRIAQTI